MKADLKGEALEAIEAVAKALADDRPITPLARITMLASLEYARRKVVEIPVLTRIRKPKSQDPAKP